ncbi:MAG: DUF2892 domain-containing protein [Bacteroidota bacterium]|nr:DUF2892 domain-containing protein [Bacteroidota bacterium]
MKCNVGKTDKIIRIIIGIIIGVIGYYYNSWWGLIGLIPIATALISFCGFYPLLGVNTCNTEKKQ